MTDLTDLSSPHAPSDPADPAEPLADDSTDPTDPLGARAPGDSVVLADGGQDLRELRDLRDRMDLRQLVDTYAYALDRRTAELFASLFDEGGELVLVRPAGSGRAPLVLDGRDGWARALAVLEPCRVTTHFVGNHLVRLAGDSATGETYCLAHEIYPADGPDRMRVRSIRYRDTYRRTNGSWLFARRELTIDWTEDRVLRSPSGP
ncbi:nuclear transport factor 2 family protein [Streptomyces sp. NBC_00576]|uniref:nuclear transport factor 2 family protein n=1 Tax=Streptomyces sp. NBC_00576 TaxID=2903665 RepID=UPI002E80836A|nr:nuclear transport factor 2 family protein [Streptomyces sp. NBC_00576]WUB74698.1 nuclear transport factor 2 family protein [Streptomyces sp. NBC_00576]